VVGMVASTDGPLAVETAGYSDLAARRPMRPDAVFWIASMSKPFAGTAIEMLVEEDKVKIDDPVDKYLPDFKNLWVRGQEDGGRLLLHRPQQPITLRKLLAHTSGLVVQGALESPRVDRLSLEQNVRAYPLEPLQFEPGAGCVYSTPGINTAGRIVEVVSGMRYEEFLRRRLFAPLGMRDTTFRPGPEQMARLAKSYRRGAKETLEETPIEALSYPLSNRLRGVSPGGGLFSTAADLAIFCRMILGGGSLDGRRYLSLPRVKEMTSIHSGDLYFEEGRTDSGWGLGWRVMREGKGPDGPVSAGSFGHGGAYATNMWIDPLSGLITIFLVQRADFPAAGRVGAIAAFRRAASL